MITAWLKHYYPVEFYASVLSIQDNKERCINYMNVIEEQFGITTVHPDINKSGIFFTPNPENNTILFGLNSIKGVGEAAYTELVAKQPYKDMADLLERTEKKTINKKVMTALIKAGCFDCWNENRYEVMNQFYELRKVKDAEYYNPEDYCKQSIIDFEIDSLEIALTAKYWFDEVANGESVTFDCEVIKLTEKYDRNGKLMAFANVVADEGYPLELVVFAATYSRTANYFDKVDYKTITVSGKKDGKKILVNKVREAR
jgi:DNA polymerase-3 subunit alpha